MVTGFIKLNGSTIGCVANQLSDGEQELAPELTVDGAAKAMKFVSFCDAFNIPILSVTNVKGLKATVCEEKRIAKERNRAIIFLAVIIIPHNSFDDSV